MTKTMTGMITSADYSGRTWSAKSAPGKLFYVHNVVIDVEENGKTVEYSGEYSSVSQTQTNFVVGQSKTFTYEEPAKDGMAYKIKPVKEEQAQFRGQNTGGGAKTPYGQFNPETSARIAKMVAYEAAQETLKLLDLAQITKKDQDYLLADKYAEWMNKVTIDQNTSYAASNAIRRAVEALHIPITMDETMTKVTERVLAKATEVFSFYTHEPIKEGDVI